MFSPTLPLAGQPDWHPVHRANALLRQALLTSTAPRLDAPSPAFPSPDPAELWGDRLYRLDPAPIELVNGPMSMGTPGLAHPGFLPDGEVSAARQPPVTYSNDVGVPDAPSEGASAEDEMLDQTAQLQLQGLAEAFYRRQRQASLIVAASVAAAFVLTFCSLILLFSLSSPAPVEHEDAAPEDGTAVARAGKRADIAPRFEPLLIWAKATLPAPEHGPSDTSIIRATPNRPLALGPLLPLGSASYLMLRGLPEEAELSAGRKTGTGSWMVKAQDAAGLTLRLANGARGDYPLDLYLLDTGNGPQARRRLVLRVEPAAQTAPATEPVAAPAIDAGTLHERAQILLGRGDFDAARRLLTQLAEDGDAEAAYELGLTYDREVLTQAGIKGIDGNPAIASAWYEYAAKEGHAGAIQRLKMLARRRGDA